MDKMNEGSEQYGLEININKTKFMVTSKEMKENCRVGLYITASTVLRFVVPGLLI